MDFHHPLDDEAQHALVRRWAALAGALIPAQGPGVVMGWGDPETQWVIVADRGVFIADRESHGRTVWMADFTRDVDARRYLMLQFGLTWRSGQHRGSLFPDGFAPGSTVEKAPRGTVLRWDVGSATFATRPEARRFSFITHLTLEDLSEWLEQTP